MEKEKTSLKKLKRVSVVDQVCNELFAKIQDGFWARGAKIPSEDDLAASFEVNRLTVRMALQKLNAIGLLHTHIGDGTYVTELDYSDIITKISEYYYDDAMLADVRDFRVPIESICIDYARKNATQEDLQALRECGVVYLEKSNQMRQNPSAAILDELVEAEFDFHYTLCKISHNSLIMYAYAAAKSAICRYLRIIIQKRRFDAADCPPEIRDPNQIDAHIALCDYLESKTDDPTAKNNFLTMIDYAEIFNM